MAETVKKSRIVSDDDLEESLMQEFNIRLKHCMSQEQVQEPSDDEEDKEENVKEVIKMEFNSVTTNGNQDDSIYDEVCPVNSSERFLYEERSVYSDTNGLPLKNGLSQEVHDKIREQEASLQNLEDTPAVETKVDVVIYDEVKNVRPILQLPTTCLTDMSESVEDQDSQEVKSSVKDRMLLSTDDTSCLLFTQTVTSPMLTPSEENIDFLKGFQRQSSQNTASASENVPFSKTEDVDQQNEDATESSNISDKLEYENVPQISTEGDVSEADDLVTKVQSEIAEEICSKAQIENIYEVIEEDVDDKQEEIYENMEILRKQSIEHLTDRQRSTKDFLEREIMEEEKVRGGDNIYESIEDTEEEEIELSNAESIEEIQRDAPEKSVSGVRLQVDQKLDRRPVEEFETIENDERREEIGETSYSIEERSTVTHKLDEQQLIDLTENELYSPSQMEIAETTGGEHQLYRETVATVVPHESGASSGKLAAESSIFDSDSTEDKSLDNPSKMVNAIKSKFLTTTATDTVKITAIEQGELSQLKAVDIMKQIHKFENKSPPAKDEVGDEENNSSSTEMTESTYVETTTTIETSSASMQDKSLKKKKSKKSRSHDKENISVNETNTDTNMQEDNYYNVNVKNLCRSFGDLTKIEDEKQPKEKPIRDRTKSLDHGRSFEILKMVDNVFGEVSVKALKSSFNKFDALQKKNVLHVRSSDSSTAQEKFNGAAPIDNTNCKACGKVVFQMEQIKAEKSVWHKHCFRCQECSKQLTVDTYQSNEGTVYCKPHFKSLFAPKVVEDEAPPSDKPDLGLEELQSLNVRERFQVFEHHEEQQNANNIERGQVNVKRSSSILSKLAKFQSKGMDVGVTDDSLNGIPIEESSSEEEPEEEVEGEDAELIRAKKAQKEKPFHFTGMSDVKSKWEHGEQNSKDVRREERKQEIQSIRDRLFMGKQGKMKEAYQQAVMESESSTNLKKAASPPPSEVCDTRSLKEKFEKGETYEEHKRDSKDADDMSVFEGGISKKSRSIFLELDANASKAPQLSPVSPPRIGNDVKKAREAESPDREMHRDPEIVRAEEQVEDSIIAHETHTATKVLSKFRQMEENMNREPLNLGPKPLKRFTPPPEPTKQESSSEGEGSASDDDGSESLDELDQSKTQDADLLEAQKAARARQLRAKFEKWEAKEIKREQQQVNIIEEMGEDQAQIESTKALRARFESLKDSQNEVKSAPKVKVNRFV